MCLNVSLKNFKVYKVLNQARGTWYVKHTIISIPQVMMLAFEDTIVLGNSEITGLLNKPKASAMVMERVLNEFKNNVPTKNLGYGKILCGHLLEEPMKKGDNSHGILEEIHPIDLGIVIKSIM